MLNARAVAMQQHLTSRAPAPHGVHSMGPRMQPPMIQIGGPVNQGIPPNNTSYASYPNPNGGPQNVQIGKLSIICSLNSYVQFILFFC